jgi:hypothetical protein
MKYVYHYSEARIGWCIYKKEKGDLIMEYLSGPYETKEHAKSEAGRLAELDA